MSEGKTYNGWSSYETWLVALWIDNEEWSHRYWREVSREAFDNSDADRTFSKAERAKLDLSKVLKENFEENTPELQGFWADLLTSAVQSVNFYEIASGWIDEVAGEKEEEAA